MTKKEHPILFSSEMVKAILEGRKTQTRRVIKPQPKVVHTIYPDASIETNCIFRTGDQRIHCPYGGPGDLLYLKEPFRLETKGTPCFCVRCIYKRGGESVVKLTTDEWYKYLDWERRDSPKSSIFMFKSLARKWYEIVSVKVERLQEITESDVWAEGINKDEYEEWLDDVQTIGVPEGTSHEQPKDWYARLWDKINGKKYPWDSNLWVWVIEFLNR